MNMNMIYNIVYVYTNDVDIHLHTVYIRSFVFGVEKNI